MGAVFHRELAIPLWFLALGAVAVSVSARATLLGIALVAIAPLAFMMLAAVRRRRLSRPPTAVLPSADRDLPLARVAIAAGTRIRRLDDALHARTLTADDASDLVRMDDDGAWQMASTAGPAESTIEQARSAAAPLLRDERVTRIAIVRNEMPPAFVEWLER